MSAAGHDVLPLQAILSRVSRSFYLTLRLLPPATREAVALAYLLARASDTVADTRIVPRAERLRLLEALDAVYRGEGAPQPVLQELHGWAASDGVDPAERALLSRLRDCLELLARQPELERRLIRQVLSTITAGQHLDLTRFPGEDARQLAALETRDELYDYCYRVAGCVGEFWSELHAARLPRPARAEPAAWAEDGRRLGRALQLTNVLRDLGRDLRHGRCYLPRGEVEALGLRLPDLLVPRAWGRLRPLYAELLAQAVDDARAGLRHVLAIPTREVNLRLAELLPLLLALKTLGATWRQNPLDPGRPAKVSRATVYWTLLRAFVAAREDRAVRILFHETLSGSGLAELARPALATTR